MPKEIQNLVNLRARLKRLEVKVLGSSTQSPTFPESNSSNNKDSSQRKDEDGDTVCSYVTDLNCTDCNDESVIRCRFSLAGALFCEAGRYAEDTSYYRRYASEALKYYLSIVRVCEEHIAANFRCTRRNEARYCSNGNNFDETSMDVSTLSGGTLDDRYMKILASQESGLTDMEYASIFHHVAILYCARKDYANSAAYFKMALEMHEKLLIRSRRRRLGEGHRSNIPSSSESAMEILDDLRDAFNRVTGLANETKGTLKTLNRLLHEAQKIHKLKRNRSSNCAVLMSRSIISHYKYKFDENRALLELDELAKLLISLKFPLPKTPFQSGIGEEMPKANSAALAISDALARAAEARFSFTGKEDNDDVRISYIQESLDLRTLALGDTHRTVQLRLNEVGDAWYKGGQRDLALNAYERCLKCARENADGDFNQSKLPRIYFNMSSIKYINGDYGEALNDCESVVQIYDQFSEQDNYTVESKSTENYISKSVVQYAYSNMGTLHLKSGNYVEARRRYNKTLELQLVGRSNENKSVISDVYFNIGLANQYSGRMELALRAYKRAMEITKLCRGDKSEEMAAIVNAQANTQSKMCKTNQQMALQLYSLALWIRQSNDSAPLHHDKIAATLVNMGMTCRRVQQIDVSISCFEDALDHLRRVGDDTSRRPVAVALNGLGNAFYDKKELESAMKCYIESLEVKKAENLRDKSMCRTLINLGNICRLRKNFDMSLQHFNAALVVWCELGSFNSEITANIITGIAINHACKGHYSKAAGCFNEVKGILLNLNSLKVHEQQMKVENMSASLERKLRKYRIEAETQYFQTLFGKDIVVG